MQVTPAVILLATDMLVLTGVVFLLFWSRRRLGLTPLYVTLGVFRPIQGMLSSSVYVEIWQGFLISPGAAMFAAGLLAVLLVYIREDAAEARRVIYGMVCADLMMTLVLFVASLQVSVPGTQNFLNVDPQFFHQGARITVVGTLVYIADVFLLIIVYTAARRRIPGYPFLRVFLTMAGVLLFDAIAFTTGVFFERTDYFALLVSAMLGKVMFAFFLSAALILYLRFIEPTEFAGAAPNLPLRDFFYSFTYREKFELQAQQTEEVEARLARAQQVAKFGFFDYDLKTESVYWSDQLVKMIGLESGQNRQTMKSTLVRVHPDDREALDANIRNAISGGTAQRRDFRMRREDGNFVWVSAEGELTRDRSGLPKRYLGTLVDITERKRIEEERLQIFERITDAFVALDRNWHYTYVNQRAGQMFGRTPEQLIGKHIWTEFPEGVGQKFHQTYERAMSEQKAAYIEEYYPPYQRWFDNYIYPSPEGLTIYFHDITEKKNAELALRRARDYAENLLSTANAMIVALDLEGRVTLFNKAAERITGYSISEFKGRSWFEVLVPKDRFPQVWSEFSRITSRGSERPFENPILTKHGEERLISWQNNEILEDGVVVGTLSFGIDVTPRRRAEEALRRSLLEKDALLKEVHHRVKNNLQVIHSLLRLETGRHQSPDTKSVLNEMQGRVQSMALLHETLYQSGTFAAVDLGAYLKKLVTQAFRALATQPGSIALELDLASVNVTMDQAIPCGLLVNELVANCLKHGFPSGRTGVVRAELQTAGGGQQLRLRVSDNGIGLPPDFDLKKVNSLGLQLVSDLSAQLGSRLEIGPAPSATFTVTFSAGGLVAPAGPV